ncbi:MAG: anaerobic ribonucleoside-triphosphate reductase activating protein [Eubacteriaceae bacterium]|nr:anaerobic ribonucleoside-triphosphate reductase activating protein [Eubacteriaceae bacterium]
MLIHGLQKLTLLDYPGRVACTVFIAGCGLNCPFCHNSDLIGIPEDYYCDDRELIEFLKKRKGLLDGVCLTGGEPLMNPGTPDLMAAVKDLGYSVKLDTNGSMPGPLGKVLERGLCDYVAMDIKNSRERYAETVGRKSFDVSLVEESLRLLRESGVEHELRTTVVRELHDEDSFRDIASWCAGSEKYFLQAFADRDTVRYEGLSAPSQEEMRRYREILLPSFSEVSVRGMEV